MSPRCLPQRRIPEPTQLHFKAFLFICFICARNWMAYRPQLARHVAPCARIYVRSARCLWRWRKRRGDLQNSPLVSTAKPTPFLLVYDGAQQTPRSVRANPMPRYCRVTFERGTTPRGTLNHVVHSQCRTGCRGTDRCDAPRNEKNKYKKTECNGKASGGPDCVSLACTAVCD